MKKSWLIGGLFAAGVLVFWLGDDEPTPSSPTASAPTPIDSYYAAGRGAPAADAAAAAGVPQWHGYSVYSAVPTGGYSFRPLTERERARQPEAGSAARSPGYAPSAVPPQAPGYAGTYAAPQGSLGYQFRPLDADRRAERYTGHFPQPFDPTLSGADWPAAGGTAGEVRSPWKGPAPGDGQDGLWVYNGQHY